jgi:DNA repair protein RadC
MYERSYGSKYDSKLDTAEIAKRVRSEIAEALKAGELPKGLKASVRTSRFAGGSAIDITVTACPFPVRNPERVEHDALPWAEQCRRRVPPLHNERARALVAKLESMLRAYNHDGSDIQSDYFDVKFYQNVRFARDVEEAPAAPAVPVVDSDEQPATVAERGAASDFDDALVGIGPMPDQGAVGANAVHDIMERASAPAAGGTGNLTALKKLELRSTRIPAVGPLAAQVSSPATVAAIARAVVDGRDREVFLAVLLDIKNRPVGVVEVATGGVDSCAVDPREVFRAAVLLGASGVVVAHNHPSGDAEPSANDRAMTLRLVAAGRLLEIPVLDHVVIGGSALYSFAEHGEIEAYEKAARAKAGAR